MNFRSVFFVFLLICCCATSAAQQQMSEAEVRLRVESISKSLRCVVCQNQSIFESNAPLAADMRRTVEARVRAGDTDEEVKEFLREPYGDFILLKPPLKPMTFLLWLGPFLLAALLLIFHVRRKPDVDRSPIPQELAPEDRDRVYEALNKNAEDRNA